MIVQVLWDDVVWIGDYTIAFHLMMYFLLRVWTIIIQ